MVHYKLYEWDSDPVPEAYFARKIETLNVGDTIEYNSSNQDGYGVYIVRMNNGEKILAQMADIDEYAAQMPPSPKRPSPSKTKKRNPAKHKKTKHNKTKHNKTSGGKRNKNKNKK